MRSDGVVNLTSRLAAMRGFWNITYKINRVAIPKRVRHRMSEKDQAGNCEQNQQLRVECALGRVEVVRDDVAEKLDEMADLCEYWKRNRDRGYHPNAIRAALIMLAEEELRLQA